MTRQNNNYTLLMILTLLFISACFLAYSNGATDNFKGVATLFGSGTTNFKKAINWATITRFQARLQHYFSQRIGKEFFWKRIGSR